MFACEQVWSHEDVDGVWTDTSDQQQKLEQAYRRGEDSINWDANDAKRVTVCFKTMPMTHQVNIGGHVASCCEVRRLVQRGKCLTAAVCVFSIGFVSAMLVQC